MPAALSYPGVYIEEVPSGVRTITGVATSITAFIGRALRGPTDEPVTINSYADFERTFGGLWADSTLGYAVRDFYLNGGSQAIIVRLYHPKFASKAERDKAAKAATDTAAAASTAAGATGATVQTTAAAAKTKSDAIAADANASQNDKSAAKAVADAANQAAGLTGATLLSVTTAADAAAANAAPGPDETPLTVGTDFKLQAAYKGSWGGNLRVALNGQVSDQVAQAMGLARTDLFNLTVTELGPNGSPVRTEQFRNLSVKDSARRIDKVLAAESKLVRWSGSWPGSLPNVAAIHTAEATLATKRQELAAAQAANASTITTKQGEVATAEQNLRNATVDTISQAEAQLAAAQQQLKTAQSASTPDLAAIAAAQTAVNNATNAATSAKKTSDGVALTKSDDFTPPDGQTNKKGIYALENADLFNLLCIPPYQSNGNIDPSLVSDAAAYCEKRRAMLIVDSPAGWNDTASAKAGVGGIGTNSKNAALFFPRLVQPNPLHNDQLETFAPCGAIAGVFARTDSTRGVWKAPAGLDATLVGVPGLSVSLTDMENGELNPLGINCLRTMPAAGRIVWGSRTLQGDDRLASEWKYTPVRRLALFIEESLYRGTQWVVFEPNDEPLWAQIRLNLGAFMHNLFRQGAFQGMTPREAYFVKCDKDTTTENDRNLGIVNIVVGFAPLKPAEFVVIKIQQIGPALAA